MHVFYEEDGSFKVGSVLADNASSLQVEAPHGKRSKIKSTNVLLRFERPTAGELLQGAERQADEIDVDFLWQCCPPQEFDYTSLGTDYFGHAPTAVESAALLIKLHGAPMYFYKKGKGRYKAAPADALKAALASVERKRKQEEAKATFVERLSAGILPDEFRGLVSTLLYDPDKNSLEYKALDAACAAQKTTPAKLLVRCGALASHHDYHLQRFLFQYFPDGLSFPAIDFPQATIDAPFASVRAFSIDDASTTEIDDAFSVTPLDDGTLRIGIHIAAPALGVTLESASDAIARTRLSTVYFPGQKITMLPDPVIEQFTLKEGRVSPVLSLYLQVARSDYSVLGHDTKLEQVLVAANLRHDRLDPVFNEATLREGLSDFPYKDELLTLYRVALSLEAGRGKVEPQFQPIDYNFTVEDDRIQITTRQRGSPLDKLVSELMIAANSTWGKTLSDEKIPAIYRVQGNGKVMMSVEPAPHQGLGVDQYAWSSSPIRRYVDLVNQRQLLAWVSGESPPYANRSESLTDAMRAFEMAYDAYAEFQRGMERYWCLRYLLQEEITQTSAAVLRESMVRIQGLPLVCRVPSLPHLAPGTEVKVALANVDVWELTLDCQFKGKVA